MVSWHATWAHPPGSDQLPGADGSAHRLVPNLARLIAQQRRPRLLIAGDLNLQRTRQQLPTQPLRHRVRPGRHDGTAPGRAPTPFSQSVGGPSALTRRHRAEIRRSRHRVRPDENAPDRREGVRKVDPEPDVSQDLRAAVPCRIRPELRRHRYAEAGSDPSMSCATRASVKITDPPSTPLRRSVRPPHQTMTASSAKVGK